MPVDLALSENNDLIFGANVDLAPIFNEALIEQRIRLRLKIPRGTWIYDDSKSLGSDLRRALHGGAESAISGISAYVHQALRPMTDISIDSVESKIDENDERTMTVIVRYTPIRSSEIINLGTQSVFTAQASFPI